MGWTTNELVQGFVHASDPGWLCAWLEQVLCFGTQAIDLHLAKWHVTGILKVALGMLVQNETTGNTNFENPSVFFVLTGPVI